MVVTRVGTRHAGKFKFWREAHLMPQQTMVGRAVVQGSSCGNGSGLEHRSTVAKEHFEPFRRRVMVAPLGIARAFRLADFYDLPL